MSIIEVKVAELIGPALDWAVAETEGIQRFVMGSDWPGNSVVADAAGRDRVVICNLFGRLSVERGGWSNEWSPSANWAQGGPLIEKHQIDLCWDGVEGKAMWWNAYHQDFATQQTHQSPLIAACRAIVAASQGDVVSVPAELVQQQGEEVRSDEN